MLEQGWQGRLVTDLGDYEFAPRTTFLRNRGSKWRVASALQKAICQTACNLDPRSASNFDPQGGCPGSA
jgi:hypothetical protein